MEKKPLTEGQTRILQAVRGSPHITATRIHKVTGLYPMYVRRVLNMLEEQGLVHVSGYDESEKRRKPRLYAPGPGEGLPPKYPYVSKRQQAENTRLYQRHYQRRQSIQKMTQEAGVFGSMVAQMRTRIKDDD